MLEYATKLKIPYFRGVFMRDALPQKVATNESGIVNLDVSAGDGTHWVAYCKRRNNVSYYDSFGVAPPTELINYLGKNSLITYSYEQDQRVDQVICGHLCLKFLNDYK